MTAAEDLAALAAELVTRERDRGWNGFDDDSLRAIAKSIRPSRQEVRHDHAA